MVDGCRGQDAGRRARRQSDDGAYCDDAGAQQASGESNIRIAPETRQSLQAHPMIIGPDLAPGAAAGLHDPQPTRDRGHQTIRRTFRI